MAAHATAKLVDPARVLLMVCAGALAACLDAAPVIDPDSEPVAGGTAVVVGSHDLQNLNPLVVDEQDTAELLKYALFTTLVRFDSAFGYQPYLAESWEEEGDTAIVFHLRRDVRWHDGRPTTAEDVAFTFRRVKDPATASSLVHLFENWVDVTVVDSHTARFRLRPHADPLYAWTELPVVPAHALDSVPPAEMRRAAFNSRPIGNGPFRFGSHRENDRWIFEANDEFPADLGGRPIWTGSCGGRSRKARRRSSNCLRATPSSSCRREPRTCRASRAIPRPGCFARRPTRTRSSAGTRRQGR